MSRLLAAIQTLEDLRAERDTVQAMAESLQAGAGAMITISDETGRLPISTEIATQVVNARLDELNDAIADLEAKLADAESRV